MFDPDTLIVTYDEALANRVVGARRKTDDPRAKGLNDCVEL